MAESAEAQAVVQAIHARFRLKPRWPAAGGAAGQPRAFPSDRPPVAREVLARSHVDHVKRDGAWLRPHLPDGARRGVGHRADVSLPARADGAFHLVDVDSGVAVDVALAKTSDVAAEVADGFIVYRRAHASGADIVHRVTAEGTEDYLVFEHPPDLPELRYQIALGDKVAGLRLVANTLELLDAGGAPRLRMAPPYVVDAAGERHEADVAVSGCEYEGDPRMPWGRVVKAPKARICEVRIVWGSSVVAYPVLVDPMWMATGSMSTARWGHTASLLTIGGNAGKVLVAGGDDNNGILASAEVYDPGTGTWSAAQSMSAPRIYHTASVFTIGVSAGKILVTGPGQSAEVYDPATNIWSTASSMSVERYAHSASVLNDGRVLVVGGSSDFFNAEIYDPATNTWADTSMMASSHHSGLTATTLNTGKVLVTGGDIGHVLSEVEVYDSATDTWTAASAMSEPRAYHTATLLNDGRVFVAGGNDDGDAGSVASAEAFDPNTNTWQLLPGMMNARFRHVSTLLTDGRVLVAGGISPGGGTAEVYAPSANTWGALSVMSVQRTGHTATLLNDGRVLVTGGQGAGVGSVASAELFVLLPQGSSCTQMHECLSGFCIDGFCCDTACGAGQCDACSTALGATMDGECSLLTGTACNDDNACTQTDTCQGGVCTGASPVTCSALDQCHDVGSCDPVTGICSNPSKADASGCSDGDACTQSDTCQSGVCIGANPVMCTALDQCHDVGTCNPAIGVCSNPNKANGSPCDDSNACTQTDTCQAGACTGSSAVTCAALDQCHDAGMCNPATGICSNPSKADGSGCSDGDACTQTDTCHSGACIGGTPVTCSALDQCHFAGTCDPATGFCSNPSKADGAWCSDGDACTQTGACQSGVCIGAKPVACTAPDPCHDAGTCLPASGVCFNPLKPDGSACGNGRVCISGVCVDGAGGSGGAGGGGTDADGADEPRTFYSCAAGGHTPADPWTGFATVWGTLALATRARRRRG